MANFARILNNVAVDVSADPENHFHPDIAAQFQPVPDSVMVGWRLVDGAWQAPPEPTPAPTEAPTEAPPAAPDMRLTRLAFLNRFLMEERIGIRTAATSDPVVQDMVALADSAQFVDLSRDDTKAYLGALVAKNLISQSRADEIMTTPIRDIERPLS